MSALSPLPSVGLARAGVLAGSLSESEASRRVYLAAGGLALLGLVLLVGTVWWWRTTRNEHPSLAPLEVMGARRWRKASEPERQRLVDGVRPEGAQVGPAAVTPEPVDLAALAIGDHAGFDDLREIDELLGMDVEHLLALKPRPAGDDAAAAGAESVEAAASDAPAEQAADVDVVGVVDETVAIGADEEAELLQLDEAGGAGEASDADLDAAAEVAVPDAPAEVELDDVEDDGVEDGGAEHAGAEHAGAGVDAADADAEVDMADDDAADDEIADEGADVEDEPSLAPGDPLLERSAND